MKKYITILYCQYCVNIIVLPKYFRFWITEELTNISSKYHK